MYDGTKILVFKRINNIFFKKGYIGYVRFNI